MFRDVVKRYYRIKTELKGIPDTDDRYYFYERNKAKLNSTYGMTVQDIAKDSIEYVDGIFRYRDDPLVDLIDKSNKKAFTNYAWGIWVTAYSRALGGRHRCSDRAWCRPA